MLNKALVMIMDGLGDRPIKELDNKTPLEFARTPNFDKIAQKSQCGLMYSLGKGIRPGSDTSHLQIFGYPMQEYYTGRGPIEVAGIGIQLQKGDIAFRGNFGTVDEKWNVIDRRAGRISDTTRFAKAIDGIEIDGIKFIVKPATAYRAGVVMRGKGLSANITDNDSHIAGDTVKKIVPKDNTKEAEFTANVLNKFMKKSYEILKELDINKKRKMNNELEANFLLLRGAGVYPNIINFNEKYNFKKTACIAGGGLYRGIGAFLGMNLINVQGATACPDTNVSEKISTAVELLNNKDYDFVFLHIKPTDSLAEDGNYMGKKDFIEKIDKSIPILEKLNKNVLLVMTADHSTSCELKAHTADPVPIMLSGEGIRVDNINKFGERDCARGGLGIVEGKDLMPIILNSLGKLPLIGA